MQGCFLPTERMKSIRSSLDFFLQLVKFGDTHHQRKGSFSHASVQEVRKWVWGLSTSLPVPKCTRQIVGSLTFSPQWPTFTFPSNYTSWCTLIYSEQTSIFPEMWEKLEKKHSLRSRNHWPLQVWQECRHSLPFFRAANYIAVSSRWSAFGIKIFCLF